MSRLPLSLIMFHPECHREIIYFQTENVKVVCWFSFNEYYWWSVWQLLVHDSIVTFWEKIWREVFISFECNIIQWIELQPLSFHSLVKWSKPIVRVTAAIRHFISHVLPSILSFHHPFTFSLLCTTCFVILQSTTPIHSKSFQGKSEFFRIFSSIQYREKCFPVILILWFFFPMIHLSCKLLLLVSSDP